MSDFHAAHADVIGPRVAAALARNNFTAEYVKSRQEAVDRIISLIPADATVGAGGSWTVGELGLLGMLEARGNQILNHGKPGTSAEEALEIRRRQLTADVFLTGTNAITLDGKLVNVDGSGNRVAAMIFGPKKVIVVAGVNKIVRDAAAADERIKLLAAPMNNIRLKRDNPCVKTGVCADCASPARICNVTTVISKKPTLSDIHIFLIGEELGF